MDAPWPVSWAHCAVRIDFAGPSRGMPVSDSNARAMASDASLELKGVRVASTRLAVGLFSRLAKSLIAGPPETAPAPRGASPPAEPGSVNRSRWFALDVVIGPSEIGTGLAGAKAVPKIQAAG